MNNDNIYESELVNKITGKISGPKNTRCERIKIELDRCQATCLATILNIFIIDYPERAVGNVIKELDSAKVEESE